MVSEPLSNFDIIAIALSGSLMFIYNVFFFVSIPVHKPTQLALNLVNSKHWIEKHKEKDDPQSTTLAVQTMRNTIMVAVFIGGYSLNFAYSIVGNYDAYNNSERNNVRAIILTVLLFASFLCWACVIRLASHLGYMVGTLGYVDKTVSEDHASDKVGTMESYTAVSVGDGQLAKSESSFARKEQRIARYGHHQLFLKKKASLMMKQMLVYFR